MAKGDGNDMRARLQSLVPAGWFASAAPVRDAILGGLGDSLAFIYQLLSTVEAGMRRSGATGWLLDLDAYGFFGSGFFRKANETDDAWRKRYTDEIFRPRVTRAAIDKALYDLTGRHPIIHEPWHTGDMGAIGVGTIGIAGQAYSASAASGVGIAMSGGIGEGHFHIGQPTTMASGGSAGAGGIGSTALPYQIFIDAFRPAGRGIPSIPGIGYGGTDSASTEIVDDVLIQSSISDAEIYACIARTTAAGVVPWTTIRS